MMEVKEMIQKESVAAAAEILKELKAQGFDVQEIYAIIHITRFLSGQAPQESGIGGGKNVTRLAKGSSRKGYIAGS